MISVSLRFFSLLFSDPAHFLKARAADLLSLEVGHAVRFSAEDAGRSVFFQDDLVILDEDLDAVLRAEVHHFSRLDGENDPPELVDRSDYSESFHR